METTHNDTSNIKIVLVGNAKVGKSALVSIYLSSTFLEEYDPTIFDMFEGNVRLAEKTISFSICDVAGSPTYDNLDLKKLRSVCYLDADVFLICFSVVDRKSFENVKTEWYPEITARGSQNILLVGTKTDLREDQATLKQLKSAGEEVITSEEGEELALEIDASLGYLECSASSTTGFKEIFDTAIRAVAAGSENKKSHDACSVM